MSWSPSRPSAARRFVDRIAGAQRRHFGTDVVDQDILHLATCRGIEDATDKAPHLLEGGSVETTRGQRRRAETNTRCHESFLRIEGNAVLVAGDAGVIAEAFGPLAGSPAGPQVDEDDMGIGATRDARLALEFE